MAKNNTIQNKQKPNAVINPKPDASPAGAIGAEQPGVCPVQAIHICVDYHWREWSGKVSGHGEVFEYQDGNGGACRARNIKLSTDGNLLIWHCDTEFVLFPEVPGYFEPPADASVYLYCKDGDDYTWAGVQSQLDPIARCYKQYVALTAKCFRGPKRECAYTLVPRLKCCQPPPRGHWRTMGTTLVRATITLEE